jgi:uncharacterized protein YecE (DUF72 family)
MKTSISAKRSNLLIGTSGWSYRSWLGLFFPRDLPEQGRLEFYARQFRTIELNGVFYRTPTVEAVRGWEERTPEGFIFAWKASKFITHWKRLNDTSRNSLALLEDRLLGKKTGPVLFQLPPQFEKDRARLASFLRLLSPQRRYAFEFPHRSWYSETSAIAAERHDPNSRVGDGKVTTVSADEHLAPTQSVIVGLPVSIQESDSPGAKADRSPERRKPDVVSFAPEGRRLIVRINPAPVRRSPILADLVLSITAIALRSSRTN